MNIERIVIKNAIKIFLGIVIFFFAMKLFGLEQVTELRILNFAIVFWGINSAIKENFQKNKSNDYLQNLFIGLFTSLVSLIMVIIGLTIYLYYIDPSFLQVMENATMWGNNLTPPLLAGAIFIEGMASSAVTAFAIMQFWKKKKISIA